MSTPQDTPGGPRHAKDPAQADIPAAGTAGRRNGNGGVPLIRLVNAGKHYGAVIALSDITMEVGPARSPACSVTTALGSPP